ncbi:hypothetical protein P692DRAFT_201873833 [Suillus brevipes Sb2]|nr:hypothetical protein P692DRAFT_201873833 [Suillus brevipes Sb2]
MNTPYGFPIEMSLLPGQFNEAYKIFMKLLAKVADETIIEDFKNHWDFLTECDDFNNNHFNMILAFDIEIHCKYFNTHTLLDESAYVQRWNKVKIDMKLARQAQAQAAAASMASNNRYQPYSPRRNDAPLSSANTTSDGKPFWRGKGEYTSSNMLL